MPNILELKNLTKKFKDLTAVNELNLSIREGICFGLLGPNGAGKTTTLEMIEGILPETSGEILYCGVPRDHRFKQEVGIQFQTTALPELIKVSEVIDLFSSLYHKKADISELRKLCDLDEFWDQDASQLSGGQRQRLLLAVALVHDPKIVFLDEPTTGLDPSARRRFWDLVKIIKKRGKSIVLTTHYMEEAYELCDEIAIMDHGKVIAQGAPNKLLQEHFSGLSIQIPKTNTTRDQCNGLPGEIFDLNEYYELQTFEPENAMRMLLDKKIPLQGLQIRTRNLEDLFLKLTGKGIET